MIYLKTDEEIELMRESNLLVGMTLGEMAKWVAPGITTLRLDKIAEEFIRDHGAEPGFLGYAGYPNSLCISVNEVIVHGIPNSYALREGDIVSIDCGVVKNGFHGRILTTRLTADLMKIMLLDSAHIQESDAEYENRKGERAGREHVDPLYTEQDALDVFKYVTTCEYKEKVDLCEGVSAVFTDAGHLLGSASITLELEENGVHKTIVFSGDIGNVDQPIIRDPQLLKKADYVVMESTYGDRNHTEVWSYTDELAEIIDETLGKGGNVVIPSFAVGRTQELLYFIREIKDQNNLA